MAPLLWPSRCVFLGLLMLNRRTRAHSAGCWLPLLHLISIFSGPQTPSGFPRAPSAGCGFPYHISSLTGRELHWQLDWPPKRRTQLEPELNSPGSSNSTELYNRSTPTPSLKSNVLSSSNGNICHAVQRSLSSGESLCSVPWEFFLARPILSANFRPRDFLS